MKKKPVFHPPKRYVFLIPLLLLLAFSLPVRAGKNAIDFHNLSAFDGKLSKELKDDPDALTVNFIAPVTVNTIPQRLDKWLYIVEKLNGSVELKPEPGDEKFLGDIFINLAVGAYDLAKQIATYSPAVDYNAVIYYDRSTGNLTRLVFDRKPNPPAPPNQGGLSGWIRRNFGDEGAARWVLDLLGN